MKTGSILTKARVMTDQRIRANDRTTARDALAGSGQNRGW